MSRDDARIYAVASDNDAVEVLEAKTESKVAEVEVGRGPSRIL